MTYKKNFVYFLLFQNEGFLNDGRTNFPSWQRSAAHNNLEVNKDFLRAMPGAEQGIEVDDCDA